MGHRADLVVIENGRTELYFSRWAASTLDEYLFWGPAAATAFFRRQHPAAEGDTLLDEIWAEGGAIIDHSTRTLLWYGGEGILFDIPRRRLHLRMMSALWQGWTIRWASEDIADIADYLGIARDEVLSAEEPVPTDAPRILAPPEDPSWIYMAITSRRNGSCEIFAINALDIREILAFGHHLLDQLRTAVGATSFDWAAHTSELPVAGIHVDWDVRELSFWYADPAPAIKSRTRARFPDWTVRCWEDRFEEQMRAAPGLILPVPEDRIPGKAILDLLLRDEQNQPALKDDVLSLSSEERRRLLFEHYPAAASWEG